MNDLRCVKRPTRKKPGMKEFFILVFCYSYYHKSNYTDEFSLSETLLAEYFECTTKTIYRWLTKLKELGFLKYAKREDAGKVGYYKTKDKTGKVVKKSYIKPKYKKIRVGKPNEIKFVNVYTLDIKGLNKYFLETIQLDLLADIKSYKVIFDDYIQFLSSRHSIKEIQEKTEELSKDEKRRLKRAKNIEQKTLENEFYLDKKAELDKKIPEFQCKYLRENCLRLTHELCSTVNPLHTDKINELNYWRSSHIRNDMLENILKTTDFVELDVNGSIYRLTYNLYHDTFLDMSIDIYELIWKTGFSIEWPNNTYRNNFKKIIMPIYMRPYLIGYKACRYAFIETYIYGHPVKYKRLPKEDKEQFELYKTFVDLTGYTIKDFLKKVRESMQKVLGTNTFLSSNIFIQESNLHILMREKFLEKGIRSANIYDGFYFDTRKITKKEFYSIYLDATQELKENLIKGIGSPI